MEIVNIVATVKLSSPLDLQRIAQIIRGTEFSSGGGKWLKMRLPPENHYIAFYKSGKILIVAARSLEQVESIGNRVISILNEAGFNLRKENLIIHNIVISDKIKLNVSLEKIICVLDSQKASYEPEQFVGLMYKDFGASFLLFSSGKFVVAGLKQIDIIENVISEFKKLIESIH